MDDGLVLVKNGTKVILFAVLILIVVDNGLVPGETIHLTGEVEIVLILIVVDNGLVPEYDIYDDELKAVLILIVVDNGLVPTR